MLYLLIRNVTATPYKHYMTSNIVTTESAYKFLSLLFLKFISKVKFSTFVNIFM